MSERPRDEGLEETRKPEDAENKPANESGVETPGEGESHEEENAPRYYQRARKAKDFKGTSRRLIRYLRPKAGPLFLVGLFAALSTVFRLLTPKVMGKATTSIFEGLALRTQGVPNAGIDYQYISRILMALAGLYLLSALFNYLQHYIMAGVSESIVYNLRKEVQAKLNRLPLKFFDGKTHGEILSRVVNDVDNLSSTLQQTLTQLITAVVTLVGVVILMLSISPMLTLVTMLTLPITAVGTVFLAKHSQKYFASQRRILGDLNGHVEEMYSGYKIIKAYGREHASIEQFKEINEKLYETSWKAQFISGVMRPLIGFVHNIGYVLVSVAGGILVMRKAIEIGDIQAFITYSRQFTQPITQTADIANVIQSTVASAERVFEVLDEEEEAPDPENPKVVQFPRGEVEFRNVCFRYKPSEPLIENMNLHVKPGEIVAIVGPTGAGKTTVVNLLMRFYEIDDGAILVDGVDIREMRREDLRRMFGMVLQDTWLFNGTVRDNIAYGREDATEEEIVRAAKAARIDHFIRPLPKGYDTVISQDASNISQGEKQLLTIARAILADPPIMILDEATSSVDTRTEIQIQQAMRTLMKGRTNFVIAHRLSTIRDADNILVMDNGRIVEQGKHNELLAKGGFYAELYNSQFAGNYLVDEAI